jgi:hypothetical protein
VLVLQTENNHVAYGKAPQHCPIPLFTGQRLSCWELPNLGFEAKSSTPEQFAEFIKAETTLWGKVIKDAKIPTID